MIDLHYWPTPNGWKISIMLEECGLPYKELEAQGYHLPVIELGVKFARGSGGDDAVDRTFVAAYADHHDGGAGHRRSDKCLQPFFDFLVVRQGHAVRVVGIAHVA